MTRFTVCLPWSSVASIASGGWGRLGLGTWSQGRDREHRELLLRHAARPPEEQERERDADAGKDGDREEGGLEALGERDQSVGAVVRRQVVVGAGDRDGGDDRDAERGSDLEARVAEPRGEPGFALRNAREGCDRGGDESEADAGAEDEQPEENVAEVAAADGDLGEEQRPAAHQRHPDRGDGPEA